MDTPIRCPACGAKAIDVDGDPFARRGNEAFGLWMVDEATGSFRCGNGHAWFESVRYDHDGNITDRVQGLSGTRSPWAEPK